jgi:hypothetical protein
MNAAQSFAAFFSWGHVLADCATRTQRYMSSTFPFLRLLNGQNKKILLYRDWFLVPIY